MAVAQGIGDSLLDDPVNGVFLVLVKFQVLHLAVKVHPGAGHSVHVRYHLADGVFQAEPLQGIGAQLADRAPYFLDAVPCDLGNKLQLLLCLPGRRAYGGQAGVYARGNAGQGVAQGIMDFPGQTVSLPCLRHFFRHHGVLFKLFIHFLKLLVKGMYLVQVSLLLVDDIHTVYHKHDYIQGYQDIVAAEQVLLGGGIVKCNVILYGIQAVGNGKQFVISQDKAADSHRRQEIPGFPVFGIENDIGKYQQQDTVIIKIQKYNNGKTNGKISHKAEQNHLTVVREQPVPHKHTACQQSQKKGAEPDVPAGIPDNGLDAA